jgi:2-desacetyl-2-hydroxyethyl bacteriochlorophyllide A dehydrogenase
VRAVVPREGSVTVVEVDTPPEGPQRLQVAEVGICGSDHHMVAAGMTGFALGHEFGGYLPDGRLVAVRPTGECGTCVPCTTGVQNGCRLSWSTAYGVAVDGGLADYLVVDPQRVYPMAEGARPVDAALVEPLAIAVHGVRRGRPEPASRALVVGAGSIGLLAAVALRSWGIEVDIVARHAHQAQAAEALGAHVVDRPRPWAYPVTFDAVCTQQTFDACLAATMPGGRLVEFGMFWAPVQMTNALLFKEVSVVPAMGYSHADDHDDVREAADLLAADHSIADTLVTHTFPLADAVEAFRVSQDRASGAIKVHLVP